MFLCLGLMEGFFHTLGAVHSCQISETSDAFFSFPVSPPIPSFLISSFFFFFSFSSFIVLSPTLLQVIKVLPVQALGGRVLTMVTEL